MTTVTRAEDGDDSDTIAHDEAALEEPFHFPPSSSSSSSSFRHSLFPVASSAESRSKRRKMN